MRKLTTYLAVSALVLGGLAAGCSRQAASSVEVKISVPGAVGPITRATIVVDYTKSGAKPQIAGGGPACTSIVPHVSCRFSDDGAGKLTIEAESPQGFSTPVDLAVCRMVPQSAGTDGATIAGHLTVALADARGSDGQALQTQAEKKVARRANGSGNAAGDSGGAAVEEQPGVEGGAAAPSARAPAAGAAPGAGATGAGQGMVVTRDDLAARERRRAEEQARAKDSQKPILVPTPGMGAASGEAPPPADQEVPMNQDGDGSGVNDPTDDDARATEYGVRFDLEQTPGPVGALQVEVNYNGGSGGWLGAGGSVGCRWMVQASLHACNDKRGGALSCAVVDTTGFSGPTALMECSFKSRNSVSAGDFSVNVVDASAPDMSPVDARVVVAGVYAR